MGGRFRKMGRAAVALVFAFFSTSLSAGPVLSTGFESGFPPEVAVTGNWTVITSSLAAHSGSRGANIIGPTNPNGDVLTLMWPSVGYQDLTLDLWSKVRDGLESEDQVLVQLSTDGVNWTTLNTWTNMPVGDWVSNTFSLPTEADNNPNLAFRFEATLLNASDRWALDDVTLNGRPVPEPATLGLLAVGAFAGICYRRLR